MERLAGPLSAGAFGESEFSHRLTRAAAALKEAGLDAAVCAAPETLFYLVGYEGYTYWSEQALILSANGLPPVLVLRDVDRPLARETLALAQLATYELGRDDPVDLIAAAMPENGAGAGRIGVEKRAYALPASYFERIASRLGDGVELADCSRLLSRLRVRKSEAELDYVRTAAQMTRDAMDSAIAAVRPGATEIQVASEIERSLRNAGSEYPAMPTMVASGPRTVAVHAAPTHRRIEAGDPVVFWYAGVSRRYHVTAYRTVHVGPPSARFRDVYRIAREALEVLIEHVRVGEPVAGAARAASAALQASGYARYQLARWGYGVGVAYPPVWLEAFDVAEHSPDTFGPGTLMCLHVCFSLPEDRFGLYVGGDYLIKDTGIEALDHIGPDLVVV